MKYNLPESQDEILPNLLGLKSKGEIELSEFEGFLAAEIIFTEKLTQTTKFSVDYILDLNNTSLKHIYKFAGELRSVNLSKGGFAFPSAKFLPNSITKFEQEILSLLPDTYKLKDDLIKDIAVVHGELLFIHPFREGNGRTARILANLMARKQGYDPLEFVKINKRKFSYYVLAVQSCASKDYSKMISLIKSIFPD